MPRNRFEVIGSHTGKVYLIVPLLCETDACEVKVRSHYEGATQWFKDLGRFDSETEACIYIREIENKAHIAFTTKGTNRV